MARTVKPEHFASKRNKILDTAQRLIFTKGFVQMSVRDILEEMEISSGAFHHYFDSREALLEGVIERIKQEVEKPLLPIIHNPQLNAIQKLQGFFDTLDQLRLAHSAEIVKLGKVWYNDSNAIVRLKVDEAVMEQRAPLLAEIVRQGVRENLFTAAYPDQAGEVILSLLQGMGDTHARWMLRISEEIEGGKGDAVIDEAVERVVTIHAAYMDAIERVLGAPANSLYRATSEGVNVWVVAMKRSG